MQQIEQLEKQFARKDLPNFKVGDTVEVQTIIREGDKQRFQKFKGVVIAIHGSGSRKTFTVRKISYGVGVEKIFPWNSTNIAGIEVIKSGSVRRSRIFYMRSRIGKLAMKIKPGQPAPVIEHAAEAQEELDVEPELNPEAMVDTEVVADAEVDTNVAAAEEADAALEEATDVAETESTETTPEASEETAS